MKLVLAFSFSVVLLLPASLQAQGPIVAVFEMEDKGSGLTPAVLGNLTDYLGVLLTKGGYRVMPRTEIRDRLKAQKKDTYKSCYDQSCQIELGRELAAAHEAACQEEKLILAVKAISDDLCKGLGTRSASTEEAEIKAAVARKEAEAARLAALKKVAELEKTHRATDKQELEKARREAGQAEAAKRDALKKAGDLEKAQSEAKLAKERAQQAERERKLAEVSMLEAKQDAERARREAQEARKHPQGRPTESYNVGIGILAIAPDITEMTIDHHELGERTGTYSGGFGIVIDADFMLTSFLSAGGTLFYGQGEFQDPDNPNDEDDWLTMHIMAVFVSFKGRLNLGSVEFRPGVAGGYQHLNGSNAGKVHGLGLSAFVETAFYLGRHFALTVDLGMNFYPLASGNEGDQTYTMPLLYFSLGAEYCD